VTQFVVGVKEKDAHLWSPEGLPFPVRVCAGAKKKLAPAQIKTAIAAINGAVSMRPV